MGRSPGKGNCARDQGRVGTLALGSYELLPSPWIVPGKIHCHTAFSIQFVSNWNGTPPSRWNPLALSVGCELWRISESFRKQQVCAAKLTWNIT
mmetsp:Transcript_19281/g.56236  ORF Transcript_19281/g.56236 Transcript_19281/m.56236 type:complete len:94 (-) Transcript_19281:19-300(-)